MKTIKIILPLFCILMTAFLSRANVLFSDDLNYPNGCIETDGLWAAYSPASPALNADVSNNLLVITTSGSEDSVAAPAGTNYPTGFTNTSGGTFVIASFTLNVQSLPTSSSYFTVLMQLTNGTTDVADVAHIFCTTKGTSAPGTYRLAIGNISTTYTSAGVATYPLDMATGITYQVVFSYDPNQGDTYPSGFLWINPSSINDNYVYATDSSGETAAQNNITIGAIGFSPYIPNAEIGNVNIGTQFSDVSSGTATAAPAIGVQPAGTTNYSGNNYTLYTAASGIDPTYQWYSNNVALTDNGSTVVGSQTSSLSLTNLQASADYTVVVADSAGSSTSAVAVVSINTASTLPIFTSVPPNQTNTLTATVSLSVTAIGTGPITYQWYFAAAGSTFTNSLGVTTPTYSFTAAYANSGTYYVVASNPAGSTNSSVFSVVVVAPTLVSIAYMHTFLTNDNANVSISGGQLFEVQGIVTTIGNIMYAPVHDAGDSFFCIQDGTGGAAVFNEIGASNNPPAGALVTVITPAESYYSELEMDPYEGGTVTVISTNNPLPAPQLLNIPQMLTNGFGAYESNLECSVVSITNVYLSTSASTYTAPVGNFPTNSTKQLFAWPAPGGAPFGANGSNLVVYVYTYTNSVNQINTNYWGKPIPSYCYEITGTLGIYSTTEPELYPTRYQDFVSTPQSPFSAAVALTNRTPTVSWPATVGATYSVYISTNLLGPWTQNFGQSYYPSTGTYTDTNSAPTKFYRVSFP